MKRREFAVLLSGAAVGWSLTVRAQSTQVAQIGLLVASSASGYARQIQALRGGLRELGYVDGKNINIELRFADDRYGLLPELAAELVRLKVDVLVTHGTAGTRAAQHATATIPIVMAVSGDAIATGLIDHLAHPGGNTTGSTYLNPELMTKRLEILREVLPSATNVAVLLNPDNPLNGPILREMEMTAKALKLNLQLFESRASSEFESNFTSIADNAVDAVMIHDDAMLIANAKQIGDLAIKQRLASFEFLELAASGGLIAYGVNFPDLYRRAAYFVDRILKGAKPGDLPVEQPTKFELVVNLKTAKALGITFPPSIMVRADEVIE
jgi:putative ABC transport system substrate-binding protein